ncbi:LPXTG cell wall anchor domain-containing protein [Streptococcus pluranimalium]|uniref:LPXTG cell wall anchor domain-containing protein n=1 Tax=Streptococcus pluranimalium TaxID=82348 RepID=UPI003F67FD29
MEGVVKGHTIITSEAGSVMRASFFADGKGEKKPTYSKDSVTVVVLDENAEPISGQKVVLRNTLGQEMGNGISDNEGKVIFSQGLHDGTFYKISVNELENISEAMPGNERSIYLTSDQMISSDDSAKPEAPKVDEKNSEKADKLKKEKEAEKTSVSKQPEASAVDKQSTSKETPTSAGEGHSISKETKTSKLDSKNSQKPLSQVSKKALPSTGEQSNSFMAWLGSACLALIAMIFLTKKKLQK